MGSCHSVSAPADAGAVAMELDGSRGEGGGQVVRTVVSLGFLQTRPIVLHSIRANRVKPGMRMQHVAAAGLAAQLCGCRVSGNRTSSAELRLVRSAAPRATVTAAAADSGRGSATNVLQAVLPALLFCAAEGSETPELVLAGGTENPDSTPADSLVHCLVPLLATFGVALHIDVCRGFYPHGGGELRVRCGWAGRARQLQPVKMVLRGEISSCRAFILTDGDLRLASYCKREIEPLLQAMSQLRGVDTAFALECSEKPESSDEAQCGVVVVVATDSGCLLRADAICTAQRSAAGRLKGENYVLGETVTAAVTLMAHQVTSQLQRLLDSGACVDEGDATWLISFMALAAGTSQVRMPSAAALHSKHLPTVMNLVSELTGASFCTRESEDGRSQIVECLGICASPGGSASVHARDSGGGEDIFDVSHVSQLLFGTACRKVTELLGYETHSAVGNHLACKHLHESSPLHRHCCDCSHTLPPFTAVLHQKSGIPHYANDRHVQTVFMLWLLRR
jgi:RNA 3'-phosphate cyclase